MHHNVQGRREVSPFVLSALKVALPHQGKGTGQPGREICVQLWPPHNHPLPS